MRFVYWINSLINWIQCWRLGLRLVLWLGSVLGLKSESGLGLRLELGCIQYNKLLIQYPINWIALCMIEYTVQCSAVQCSAVDYCYCSPLCCFYSLSSRCRLTHTPSQFIMYKFIKIYNWVICITFTYIFKYKYFIENWILYVHTKHCWDQIKTAVFRTFFKAIWWL